MTLALTLTLTLTLTLNLTLTLTLTDSRCQGDGDLAPRHANAPCDTAARRCRAIRLEPPHRDRRSRAAGLQLQTQSLMEGGRARPARGCPRRCTATVGAGRRRGKASCHFKMSSFLFLHSLALAFFSLFLLYSSSV